MQKETGRRALIGTLASLAVLGAAIAPGGAQAEVVTPHVVTPNEVTAHAVTPQTVTPEAAPAPEVSDESPAGAESTTESASPEASDSARDHVRASELPVPLPERPKPNQGCRPKPCPGEETIPPEERSFDIPLLGPLLCPFFRSQAAAIEYNREFLETYWPEDGLLDEVMIMQSQTGLAMYRYCGHVRDR